jgi:hypothetical protein
MRSLVLVGHGGWASGSREGHRVAFPGVFCGKWLRNLSQSPEDQPTRGLGIE